MPDSALDAISSQADFTVRVDDFNGLESSFIDISERFCTNPDGNIPEHVLILDCPNMDIDLQVHWDVQLNVVL